MRSLLNLLGTGTINKCLSEPINSSLMSFKHPALWIISGASQSGKSEFCCRLVKHADVVFNNRFDHIIWCYFSESAAPRDKLPSTVTFFQGIPDNFSDFPPNSLFIIDDCQSQAAQSKSVLDLFTRGSHHDRQTVCLVVQNLFLDGKYFRTLALNTHVYVCFRSVRDKAQIAIFFRQITPSYWRELTRTFEAATSKQYSYFVCDLHPANEDPKLRFRSQIVPDDPFQSLYCLPESESCWVRE